MASNSTTHDGEASKLFQQALQSFTDSIPSADREAFQQFRDARSIVHSMEEIMKSHPVQDSRITGAFRKFENFVTYLEPYFQIVGIFVSAKPEFAALLSSNYVTFLEKMGDMFQEITKTLPAYERFVVVLETRATAHGSSHPRLGNALALIYVDILRFCHSAYLLFSNQKRDSRLKFGLIGRLLWQPFDAQFQGLLSRLERQKEVFELEASLASTEEIMRVMDEYEKEVKDSKRKPHQEGTEKDDENAILARRASALQKWFRSPGWMDSFERAKNLRSHGTGIWVLKSKAYQDWRKTNESSESTLGSRTLNIQAKPGYGKTVLCSTMIEDLGSYALNTSSPASHRSSSVVFYFFDRRREAANSPGHAFRAILAQLVHLHRHNQQVIDMASVLFARQETGESVATDDEVIAVLEVLLDHLPSTYMVFDALDECSDYSQLFETLEKIATKSRTCAILLLSRPSVRLPLKLWHDCFRLQSQSADQDQDLVLYLHPQVEELVKDELFPESLQVDEAISKIIGRANGMFLWTRLLIEYLRLPSLTTRDRVNALDNLNRLEGLDSMYRAIFSGLEKQFPGTSIKSVCRLFQLVAYSERLLDLDELRCAISVPLDSKQTRDDLVPNLARVLGPLSGSLIELSVDGKAQFIHLSTKEFFWDASSSEKEDASAPSILTNPPLANRNIAASCLSYLIHTVPPEPLAGSSWTVPDRTLCRQKYPLLSYAARYWYVHLANALAPVGSQKERSTSDDASWSRTAQLIDTFLTNKRTVMAWIEASWLFKSPPNLVTVEASMLAPALPKDCPSRVLETLMESMNDLHELATDLQNLDRSWSYILDEQPNEIWEPSISAFSQSRFLLPSSNACINRIPFDKLDRKGFIILQSRLSRDGREIGIVKLFPTECWLQAGSNTCSDSSKESPDVFNVPIPNWKATYELWSLAPNKLLQTFEIVLQDKALSPFVEIRTEAQENSDRQERKSAFPSFHNHLKKRSRSGPQVSLPLDISDDLRRIITLDVSVAILPVESQANVQPSSCGRLQYQHLNLERRQPTVHIRRDKYQIPKAPGYKDFYHLKFSRSNEFFVIIRESHTKDDKYGRFFGMMWLLEVFHDENFGRNNKLVNPSYKSLVATAFFAVPEIALLSPVRGVAFHPWLPCLAFPQILDGHSQTYIWQFRAPVVLDGTPHSNPYPVHEPPIVDVVYSDDGKYLHGTQSPFDLGSGVISEENMKSFRKPITVRAPDHTTPSLLQLTSKSPSHFDRPQGHKPSLYAREMAVGGGLERKRGAMSTMADPATHQLGLKTTSYDQCRSSPTALKSAALELASATRPAVQRMNTLAFAADGEGVAHISQLQQLEQAGAVVLSTLGTDGMLRTETLSRLPSEVTRCVDVSIVMEEGDGGEGSGGDGENGSVRIVLDKARRRGPYTLDDVDDVALPAVIRRSKASVPKFVATVPLGLVFEDAPGEVHHRGLIEPE